MAATTMAVGDLAIIGVNTEDSGSPALDSISFVLLNPIGSGTVIYFTDRSWNGTVLSGAGGGEGTYTYTAGADVPAGTVITITQANLTAAGMGLLDTGETIYVYQGALNVPTTFLYAIDIADGNTTFNGSLANTGLSVAAGSAVAIGTDNASFGTRGYNIQTPTLLQQISNPTDWVQNENSPQPDQYTNGSNFLTAPDKQIWVASSGAGEAITMLNIDGTVNSSNTAYQITHAFQNDANLYHPSDITLDTVNDKFFFVNADLAGNNKLMQGSISQVLANPGAAITLTTLYSNTDSGATNSMRTLSIDPANGKIYFDVGTTFVKVNYDTANQTPTVLANLSDGFGAHYITQATIDYTTGEVYLGTSSVTSVFGSDFVDQNYIYKATGLTSSSTTLTFTQLPFNPDDAGQGPEGGPLGGEAWPVERGTIRGIDVDPVNHDLYIVTGTVILDNDSNGLTTYYGGIYKYDLDSNATGTVTTLFQQDGTTGPVGLLYYIEVDPSTGKYYVVDESGANAVVGDGGVWVGSTSGGTPTLLGTVGNINGLGPQGLEIQDAPNIDSATALAPTITETAGNPSPDPTAVQPASTFSLSDLDSSTGSSNLRGAQVRISSNFQSGATHQDVLTISGATSGTSSGIAFAYDSTTGVMTLTGVSTFANYDIVMSLVRYHVTGDNPTNYGTAGTRTLSYSTFDGLLYSDEFNASVTVVGVNDAPINAGMTGTFSGAGFSEDNAGVALTGISVSDVDADPASQNLVFTFSVAHGTLTLLTNVAGGIVGADITAGANGSATITVTATQNEMNATLAAASGLVYIPTTNFNGNDSLTIVSNDQGFNGNDPGNSGTGTTEQDSDSKTITISAVNDAPVRSGDGTEVAAAILEDVPLTNVTAPSVSTVFGGQFTDVTDDQTAFSGSLAHVFAGVAVVGNGSSGATGQWQYWTGVAWTDIGAASLASAQLINATALIRFNPALDYNGAAPTLTVRLVDSSGTVFANGDDVDLTVVGTGGTTRYSALAVTYDQSITPVNDAPTSSNLQGNSVTSTEGDGAVVIDAGADAALADIDSTDFAGGSLTISISAGAVAGQDELSVVSDADVTVAGADVSVGGNVIATFTGGGAGAGNLVFTLNGFATPATVAQLMQAIRFTNTGSDTPTDGDRTITWTLVDGDGTANNGADTLVVTTTVDVDPVNDAPLGTDNTVSIDEDTPYTFAAVDFGYDDVEGHTFEKVKFTSVPFASFGAGGIMLDVDGAGGADPVEVIAGQEVLVSEIALGHVYFVPGTNANGVGEDSFSFQVMDSGGTADGGVNTDPVANSFVFNIAAVNDAPTITGPASYSASEQVALSLKDTITIADVDILAATITITLSVDAGELSVTAGDSGAIVTVNSAQSVGISGTLAQVQALLASTSTSVVTYTINNDSPPASATLTIGADDGGATGTGGAKTDSENVTINITPVNDEPAGTDGSVTGSEDDAFTFTPAHFGFTDTLDGHGLSGVIITTLPPGTKGELRLSGTPFIAGTTISFADIDAGNLTFVPVVDLYGTPFTTFTFQVVDDGGSPGQDTDQSANTMTINLDADNFAPVLTVTTTSGAVAEEGTLTASSTLSYTDADSGAPLFQTVSVTASYNNDASWTGGTLTSTQESALTDGFGADQDSWQYSVLNADLQFLGQGETVTATYDVTATDDSGAGNATDTEVVTITITGANDGPLVTNAALALAGAVTEDGHDDDGNMVSGTAIVTGTLSASDADANDNQTWSVEGTPSATYGTMAVDASTGVWTYDLDNTLTTTQALMEGETVTQSYTLRVTDDFDAYADQTVTVTLYGTNDVPVIGSGGLSGTATEDGHLDDGSVVSGTALVTGTVTASDVDASATQSWSLVDATPSSTYGNFAFDASSSSWTYTLDNTLTTTQALMEGETVTQSYTLRVTDDFDAYADQTVTVTLYGTNDVPVIGSGGLSGTATEDGHLDDGSVVSGTALVTGTVTASDVDASATQSWSLVDATPSSTYGNFAFDASSSSWTYTLDNTLTTTQALMEGETVTQSYTLRVTDDFDAYADQTVTVTLYGTNDVPVIGSGGLSGTATEDGHLDDGSVVSGTALVTGTVTASDVDASATQSWSLVDATPSSTYGTISVDASTGGWTYTLDNTLTTTQALMEGETVTQSYTLRVTDDFDAYADQTVTVTLYGTNDVPVIGSGGLSGTATEDGHLDDGSVVSGTALVTGTVTASDVDASATQSWSLVDATPSSTYGNFAFDASSSSWTYTLDNTLTTTQALMEGETVTQSYTLRVTDDFDAYADQTVTVTLYGTNDVPVIGSGGLSGTATEDGHLDDGSVVSGTALVTGTVTASDVDASATQSWSLVDATPSSTYGNFAFDASSSSWTYTLDNTLTTTQALMEGETVTQSYTLRVTDDFDAYADQTVTVTVYGTNDAPVITNGTGALAGTASEQGNEDDGTVVSGTPSVTGTLGATDVDASATQTWSVTDPTPSATYGTIAVDASTGVWTYSLDNTLSATEALMEGETVTQTYTLRVTDDFGAYVDQTVTVTINGTNDVPVATNAAAELAGSVTEDGSNDDGSMVSGIAFASGSLTATDVDASATQTWSVEGAPNTTYGSISVDASTGVWTYTLDNTLGATQALMEGQVVNKSYTLRVTDDFGAYVDQTVTVTINGTNDAPVVTNGSGALSGTVSEQGNEDSGTVVSGMSGVTGTLTATDVDASATQTWTVNDATPSTTYGTMAVDASSGVWTYSLDNTLTTTQALMEGETVTQNYTLRLTDDFGAYVDQSVTVTINGTNDSPVITNTAGAVAGTVTEDGHLDDGTASSGTSSATGTVSATDVDASATQTWSIEGTSSTTYGNFAFDVSTGVWTYTLDNSLSTTQSLMEGQTATQSYTLRVTDDFGAYVDQAVTVTINGTNDVPVIGNGTGALGGAVTEQGNADDGAVVSGWATVTGTFSASDVDASATQTWSVNDATPSTTFGNIAVEAGSGLWTYVLDNTLAATQALMEGETVTQNYTIRVTDDFGAYADRGVTVTVYGTNDVPAATATGADLTGDARVAGSFPNGSDDPGTPVVGGTVAVNDPDAGTTLTWTLISDNNAEHGSFSLNSATGAWSYTIDNNLESVHQIPEGDIVTHTYTVRATDERGAYVDQTITVNIEGNNTVPTLNELDTVAVGTSEDTEVEITYERLVLRTSPADADGEFVGFVVTEIVSGTLRIGETEGTALPWAAGTNDSITPLTSAWWTPPANVDTLIQGAFYIVAEDEDGDFSAFPRLVEVEVLWLNDAPTGQVLIGGNPIQGEILTATPQLQDLEMIASPFSYQWTTTTGGVTSDIAGATGATLLLTQALTGTDVSVRVTYVDGRGTPESFSSAMSFLVMNVNDVPTGTVVISGSATQNQTLVAVNALSDPDGMGPLTFIWRADGVVITGTSGNALVLGQAQVGKAITVEATYTDGAGNPESVMSAPTGLVINVNDAPVVNTALAATSANVRQAWTYTVPGDTFADVDGDALTLSARMQDGSNLPGWLQFNAVTGTFSARPPTAFADDVLAIAVKATDPSGASATSVFMLTLNDPTSHGHSGKVVDGYIAGAAIYVDYDGDNQADADENTGLVTDAFGQFSGTISGFETLLAVGGVNIDTGLPNVLTLMAPNGMTIISPISTLVESLMDTQGMTLAQAQAAVMAAFDLPAGIDLNTYDPLAQSGDAGSLVVQKVIVQLAIAAQLGGSGAMAAIADLVADGGTVDLGNAATIALVLSGSSANTQAAVVQGNLNVQVAGSLQAVAIAHAGAVNDVTAPGVATFSPAAGASSVDAGANIVLTFNEGIQRGTGNIVLKTAAGAVVETFDAATSNRITLNGNTLTVDPTASLLFNTGYKLELAAGSVKDYAGNNYAGTTAYAFTTSVAGVVRNGTSGPDILTGTLGNDTFNGFDGLDKVVFTGNLASYDVQHTSTGFTVSGIEGFDTLTSIERLQFADVNVALDTDGNGGQAYRLYQAAFNRTPDQGGLGFQINKLDIGFGITDIAANFIESPEFVATYGSLSNTQFVTQLYLNVLHRGPDEGGLGFHVNNLQLGLPRNYLLVQFSESPENKAALLGVIEDGMVYTL